MFSIEITAAELPGPVLNHGASLDPPEYGDRVSPGRSNAPAARQIPDPARNASGNVKVPRVAEALNAQAGGGSGPAIRNMDPASLN
jgi:hypothetical protein